MMLRKVLLGTTAVLGAGMVRLALPGCGRCGRGQGRWLPSTSRSPASCAPSRSVASRTTCISTSPQSRSLDFRNDTEVHVIARAQERGDRPRVRCHDRVRGRHQQHRQHRRDLDLPARRLGRAPVRRRGRRGRQQRGRWPDDRGRHRRYRRLGRGRSRRRRWSFLTQHQRRDQDPLLHAELRRLQPRRVATRRPSRTSTAAPTTARPSPPRMAARSAAAWMRRTSSRVPWSMTAIFGGVGVPGLGGRPLRRAEERRRATAFDDDEWWGVQGGAALDLFGFKLAGSVGHDKLGDAQRDFFTAGIGAALGPVNTSLTYGQIFDANSDFEEATRHRRLGLQPGALGRCRAGAGPGAGRRRGLVRQRRRRGRHRLGDDGWAGRRPPRPSLSEPRILHRDGRRASPAARFRRCRRCTDGSGHGVAAMHLAFARQ